MTVGQAPPAAACRAAAQQQEHLGCTGQAAAQTAVQMTIGLDKHSPRQLWSNKALLLTISIQAAVRMAATSLIGMTQLQCSTA